MIDVLVIDDEADIRTLICDVLGDEGHTTRSAGDSAACAAALSERAPDLLLLDVWLQGSEKDGLQILKEVRRSHPELPVVMISGHGNIEMAVAAIRDGAYDFIEKPFKIDRLLLVVERAAETLALKRENRSLRWRANQVSALDGGSAAIQKLRSAIERAAPTNSRLLVTGPVGAGKEVICRVAHRMSTRADKPFLIASLGGGSTEVLARSLFGWSGRPGLFEQADGGVLVLDAIEDAPLEIQAALVRVLQENRVRRSDDTMSIPVDVRVMACATRDLTARIAEGAFREDLYFRLNVVAIEAPPLRERAEDLPVLAERFLADAAEEKGIAPRALAADALAAMQGYSWPGNVRQLKNVVDWLMTMSAARSESIIRADALPPEISGVAPAVLRGDWSAEVMDMPLRDAREAFERAYLETQIFRFRGNISRTAQHVGMERSALHRKLKALGVGAAEAKADAAEEEA